MTGGNPLKRLYRKLFPGIYRGTRILTSLDLRGFDKKTHSCPVCDTHCAEEELQKTLYCCPGCGNHFRINALERIRIIADNGEFTEFATLVKTLNPLEFPGYEKKLEAAEKKSGLDEAVKVGICRINGRKAVLGVMSFQFMGGSMGSVVGERVARAVMVGVKRRLPVVIFTASGGARMQEGILSLMQMSKTSYAIARLDEMGLPLIIVLTDPTTAGVTASFAMLGDVILAEPDALIGFAGRRVIEGTIRQKLPENFQSSEFQLERGFVDAIVERKDLKDTLSFLIDTCNCKRE